MPQLFQLIRKANHKEVSGLTRKVKSSTVFIYSENGRDICEIWDNHPNALYPKDIDHIELGLDAFLAPTFLGRNKKTFLNN